LISPQSEPFLATAELLTVSSLTLGSFVATNLDNLLILVMLQGSTGRSGPLLAGFLAAHIVVMLVSMLGLVVGAWLDAGLVGYLGVFPLVLGLTGLWRQFGKADGAEDVPDHLAGRSGWQLFAGTCLLMLGNSGDSLALLLPLLADTQAALLPPMLLLWLLAALGWACLVRAIGANRQLARTLEQQGQRVLPWVMIIVGIYILLDTATDTLS
jgi:cadmium resistance protein CadD (predicted permease)